MAEKLGLKPGQRAWFSDMPDNVRAKIDTPVGQLDSPEPPVEAAHLFVTHIAMLDCELRMLPPLLARDSMIRVSWPKQTLKVPTDITET